MKKSLKKNVLIFKLLPRQSQREIIAVESGKRATCSLFTAYDTVITIITVTVVL